MTNTDEIDECHYKFWPFEHHVASLVQLLGDLEREAGLNPLRDGYTRQDYRRDLADMLRESFAHNIAIDQRPVNVPLMDSLREQYAAHGRLVSTRAAGEHLINMIELKVAADNPAVGVEVMAFDITLGDKPIQFKYGDSVLDWLKYRREDVMEYARFTTEAFDQAITNRVQRAFG